MKVLRNAIENPIWLQKTTNALMRIERVLARFAQAFGALICRIIYLEGYISNLLEVVDSFLYYYGESST